MTAIYYKMRQKLIIKCVRFFITKYCSFIAKCDSYYKIRRLSQNILEKIYWNILEEIEF